MFELYGQHYVWSSDEKTGTLVIEPPVELNKENGEIVFTGLLDQAHLSRLPIGDGKTFRIVSASQRKELESPTVEASAALVPNFGPTWDWITMRYRLKSKALAASIEMNYRFHVPREARLQGDSNAGIIIVSGSTPVVRQMYDMLKAADVEPSTAMIQLQKKRKKN
jgi:molybdenum cofactor biosynthesis enzyme